MDDLLVCVLNSNLWHLQELKTDGTLRLVNAECGVSPSAGARDNLSPGSLKIFSNSSCSNNLRRRSFTDTERREHSF